MQLTNKGKLFLPLAAELNRILLQPITVALPSVRNFAARKGTRERKQKKHVKKVVEKATYIPHHLRKKEINLEDRPQRKFDDSHLPLAEDNVFLQRHYKMIVYPFKEAIKCHRQVQHPDIYNNPNANLQVTVELNMQAEKKTRFIDNFSRVVAIPNKFKHGQDRTILAFVKDEGIQADVRNAGGHVVGGIELIKDIQNGALSVQDFTYVIAHPTILPELVPLRGLLKKKFPNPKAGTLDIDLPVLVDRFLNGIHYSTVKDEYEKDFGIIQTVIGTLNMDPQHLEENFAALVRDIMNAKPKRDGHFISRCLLLSPPSDEELKVDHLLYVKDDTTKEEEEEEADIEVISVL